DLVADLSGDGGTVGGSLAADLGAEGGRRRSPEVQAGRKAHRDVGVVEFVLHALYAARVAVGKACLKFAACVGAQDPSIVEPVFAIDAGLEFQCAERDTRLPEVVALAV